MERETERLHDIQIKVLLENFKREAGINRDKDIATVIGIDYQGAASVWKSRNTIPWEGGLKQILIYCYNNGIDINRLIVQFNPDKEAQEVVTDYEARLQKLQQDDKNSYVQAVAETTIELMRTILKQNK